MASASRLFAARRLTTFALESADCDVSKERNSRSSTGSLDDTAPKAKKQKAKAANSKLFELNITSTALLCRFYDKSLDVVGYACESDEFRALYIR